MTRFRPLLAALCFLCGQLSAGESQVPGSFAYVLQADSFAKTKSAAVERLAACGRDWIVLDATFNSDTPWERADLEAIRRGQAGRKVIAYISIGEAEDYATTYGYDDRGNMTSYIDAEGGEWSFTYSSLSRLLTATDAEGRITSYDYDTAGNIVSVTDASGEQTLFENDGLGRLATVTDRRGNETHFTYDAGTTRVASVTNAR